MPPKRFEGKFGIPPSHPTESLLTQALYRLPESVSPEQVERLATHLTSLVDERRLQDGLGESLTPEEKQTLYMKLARHYEDNGESARIDIPTCVDALVESPRFLQSDKGSIEKLFEIHEMKTLQKIAEIRRKRAETEEGLNPYENLFETTSGNYYMARLLNMPHLEKESEYMDHCVGTSTSYINKMKRGDVEILSFRDIKSHEPVITLEYNRRTKVIEQMKKEHDYYLIPSDPYFTDVIDALKQLRTTRTDTGEVRDFVIEPSELSKIQVEEFRLITDRGDVSFRDIDLKNPPFILKRGEMPIGNAIPPEDRAKIFELCTGIEMRPSEVAASVDEITPATKAYVGEWNPSIYNVIKEHPQIVHLYESFPDKEFFQYTLEPDLAINSPEAAREIFKKKNIHVGSHAEAVLDRTIFSRESKTFHLVQFTVSQLGLKEGTRFEEVLAKAQQLGLELCPAEVGPLLRAAYQGTDRKIIAMNQLLDDEGDEEVFELNSLGQELHLGTYFANGDSYENANHALVFVYRK